MKDCGIDLLQEHEQTGAGNLGIRRNQVSSSLTQLCELVAGVAMESAAETTDRLLQLLGGESLEMRRATALTVFAFMNFTFAQGVWSNLENATLRRDLLSQLRDELILRLASATTGSSSSSVVSARAVRLAEELTDYLRRFISRMQEFQGGDSRLATLFALEQLQGHYGLSDEMMNRVVPNLVPSEGLSGRVEAVALQVNEAAGRRRGQGFWARIFGS